jgi:hypothetical protein
VVPSVSPSQALCRCGAIASLQVQRDLCSDPRPALLPNEPPLKPSSHPFAHCRSRSVALRRGSPGSAGALHVLRQAAREGDPPADDRCTTPHRRILVAAPPAVFFLQPDAFCCMTLRAASLALHQGCLSSLATRSQPCVQRDLHGRRVSPPFTPRGDVPHLACRAGVQRVVATIIRGPQGAPTQCYMNRELHENLSGNELYNKHSLI